MAKRYKVQVEQNPIPDTEDHLPTDRPIAVYYRQSTNEQVGNVSTAIQTVDMVDYLKKRGWSDSKIILIDMDAGVSGSKKIDERPGMSMLFDLITDGAIGAVACQDEDRLFRDVTQIQVNIFIEACRAARVQVLTPSMVYNFANELVGSFHARQFRFKSEMAAEYISSVIRGKLHRARQRMAMDGLWTGAGIPVGYIVDIRKNLPDGSPNPNWRKYTPFDPYAEVVREYFRLFLANNGNLRATLRHILEYGPFYPDPSSCRVPDGFKTVYQICNHGKGYCPTKTSLQYLLTNAVFVGHWVVDGAVVRWNNHPAIVPQQTFLRAYNYLMDVTFEGRPNPNYKPYNEHARPSLDEERPVERPICAGMIVSWHNGQWRNVGTEWKKAEKSYRYILLSAQPECRYIWSKFASHIDDAVVNLLQRKLKVTFDEQIWEQVQSTFGKRYQEERERKMAQLSALERVMENLMVSLETLNDPDMIRQIEVKYEDAKAERKRLQEDIAQADDNSKQLDALNALKENCGPALENWSNLTRDQIRRLLHAFIKRIEANPVSNQMFEIKVFWLDGNKDVIPLPRKPIRRRGQIWSDEEEKTLLMLIDVGASQIEICAAFPKRTWRKIYKKLYHLRGNHCFVAEYGRIGWQETYEEYISRIQGKTISHNGSSRARWMPDDEARLLEMLDIGSTKMEIAQAFPYRAWRRIRERVSELRGKYFRIHGKLDMKFRETFVAYCRRTHQENKLERDDNSPIVPELPVFESVLESPPPSL